MKSDVVDRIALAMRRRPREAGVSSEDIATVAERPLERRIRDEACKPFAPLGNHDLNRR